MGGVNRVHKVGVPNLGRYLQRPDTIEEVHKVGKPIDAFPSTGTCNECSQP